MTETIEQQNDGLTPSTPSSGTSENKPARDALGRLLPGNTANPGGRTPGISITAAIRKKLEENYPIDPCFCDCHKPGAKDEDGNKTTQNSQSESCAFCHETHNQIDNDRKNQKTYLEKVISAIFDNGIRKMDPRTLKDIWAYIDGLPKGSFDLGVDREGLAELTEFMKVLANPKKDV